VQIGELHCWHRFVSLAQAVGLVGCCLVMLVACAGMHVAAMYRDHLICGEFRGHPRCGEFKKSVNSIGIVQYNCKFAEVAILQPPPSMKRSPLVQSLWQDVSSGQGD